MAALLATSAIACSAVIRNRDDTNENPQSCLTVYATEAGTFTIRATILWQGLTVYLQHPQAIVKFPILSTVFGQLEVKGGRDGATSAEGAVEFTSLTAAPSGLYISGGKDVTFPRLGPGYSATALRVTGRVGRVHFGNLVDLGMLMDVYGHTEDGIYMPVLRQSSGLTVKPVAGATSRITFGTPDSPS